MIRGLGFVIGPCDVLDVKRQRLLLEVVSRDRRASTIISAIGDKILAIFCGSYIVYVASRSSVC